MTDADQIRARYSARVEDIKGRRDLSDEGRRRQLAKLYVKANAQMRQAREQHEADRATQEQALLRRLFGNPNSHDATSVVSFRDAQDRAEAIKTPGEALELLQRARRSGDNLLVRAVAMQALDRAIGNPTPNNGWGAVLDTWSTDEPRDVDDALTELGELHRQNDVGPQWAGAIQHSLPKPSEIAGVANLDALARDADSNPAEDEAPPTGGHEFFGAGHGQYAGGSR